MSDAHLGNRIHDLLDNRLSAEQTADAMAHLDACADCRLRWDDLRSAREALRTSSAGIDMTFARQLLDRDHMAEVARGESKHVARAASGRGHNPVLMLAIVMAVVGASVGVLYSLGAPQEVTLAAAEGSADQAAAVPVSFYEASKMRSGDELRDWASPAWDSADLVPVEAKVVTDSAGGIVLVQSLLSGLDTIVITEQRGELVDDLAERFPTVDVAGSAVYLVNENPHQIVWQCGELVISATCDCAVDTLESVAASFPSDDPAGVLARVVDGVERIADVVAGD
ncbi:anti-sigma factor [Demequina sp. NBRC 110055]|uniref:anti-sigma factor family protein n=1 Tax=Demequina sp. NBRC 110055 TaxID=1570344 RepID=UPI0009FF6A47|nr:zf-HC2 domain-containing protein [Demequina sp. NBRC 110055]